MNLMAKYHRIVFIAIVLAFFALVANAQERYEVVLGQSVQTDNALLCNNLDSAKTLADIEDNVEVNMIARVFMASGFCRLAEGSMVVDSLVYKGKAYNVFSAHDSIKKFYWVTVTKAQAI